MKEFDEFWKAYPKRKGSNPMFPARTKWDRALKMGATSDQIINAARAYASQLSAEGKIDTEYVCQAATWLNQHRYQDFALDKDKMEKHDAFMKSRGWEWDGTQWVNQKGEVA